MSEQQHQGIHILGRDYQFKVPASQHALLAAVAATLDSKLQALHKSSPLTNRDQLLVLTALNTLLELQQAEQAAIQQQQQLGQLLQQIKTTQQP